MKKVSFSIQLLLYIFLSWSERRSLFQSNLFYLLLPRPEESRVFDVIVNGTCVGVDVDGRNGRDLRIDWSIHPNT
jgi:hypothetical protein